MTFDGSVRTTAAARRLLSRHLGGVGIELGPGHVPFPLPSAGIEVRYVDRWTPDENRQLFPELGDEQGFPVPDVVCNFDADRLAAFDDQSQDYVVASHILEHLAEPLGMLDDMHRVLRPGGVLLLLIPDRHRTFDRDRDPTPLSHLVDERARGVTEVDDDHVAEFLTKTGTPTPADPDERRAHFDLQRRRSIHVHVWNADEFFEVLLYANAELGHGWEMVDGVLPEDEEEPYGCDIGWVLRRAPRPAEPAVMAARLREAWDTWRSQRLALHREREDLAREREELTRELQRARAELAAAEARVADRESRAHASVLRRLVGSTGQFIKAAKSR